MNSKCHNYAIEYFFKTCDDLETILLKYNNIYDFMYPEYLEDLSFYKNDKCFMKSTAHKKTSCINCDDEEEYEHLKSLGIEFCDD